MEGIDLKIMKNEGYGNLENLSTKIEVDNCSKSI
jgi:hypothetical protein